MRMKVTCKTDTEEKQKALQVLMNFAVPTKIESFCPTITRMIGINIFRAAMEQLRRGTVTNYWFNAFEWLDVDVSVVELGSGDKDRYDQVTDYYLEVYVGRGDDLVCMITAMTKTNIRIPEFVGYEGITSMEAVRG